LGQGKSFFWVNYHWLAPDYFAFHSSPWTMELVAEQYKRNEEGYILGTKYSPESFTTQLSFKYAKPVKMPMYEPGSTMSARDEFEIYWDNSLNVSEKVILKYRNTNTFKDRTASFGEPPLIGDFLQADDSSVHIPYRVHKNRFETVYEPESELRLKLRYETVDNTYRQLGISMFGYTVFVEIKYKPSSSFTIYSRATYWDAPAGVSSGAMEYTWPNSLIPFGYYSTYSAQEKDFRFYVMPTLRLSSKSKLWMKCEFWPKRESAAKNVFKMQYDCSW
jgi:hypothetical protein